MDSFEWNKIAGAVLFALLLTFGLGIFSEIIFSSEAPETPGYVVAVATEAGAPGGVQKPAEKPIGVLLASADAKKGEAKAKVCTTCHDFTNGGPNKVGPNLWGVVGRPIASHPGYEYDDPMKTFAQDAHTWTFEHLNTFLSNPKGTVPGTKMAFAGLKNDSGSGQRHRVSADPLRQSPAPAGSGGSRNNDGDAGRFRCASRRGGCGTCRGSPRGRGGGSTRRRLPLRRQRRLPPNNRWPPRLLRHPLRPSSRWLPRPPRLRP